MPTGSDKYSISEAGKEVAEKAAWTLAAAAADATNAGALVSYLQLLRELHGAQGDEIEAAAPANGRFLENGFSGRSPVTIKYLRGRARKGMAGSALAFTGSVGSQVTQVDAVGILQHGNASASTIAHMKMLREIAMRYPRSTTIQAWVNTCMVAKSAKLAIRATDLAGAAIPIGAVGISTSLASALGRAGIRLKYETVICRCAMELHWRARVEMSLSGLGGRSSSGGTGKPNGPASSVLFELFRRRGLTRFLGQYETAKIINEPGGWNAVKDKLMLM